MESNRDIPPEDDDEVELDFEVKEKLLNFANKMLAIKDGVAARRMKLIQRLIAVCDALDANRNPDTMPISWVGVKGDTSAVSISISVEAIK